MRVHSLLPARRREGGAVLVIGMVLMLMMTLVAVAVIRLSMTNTQVVNNEQLRTEAAAASHYALDFVLNLPASVWDAYEGAGTSVPVNLGLSDSADNAASTFEVTVSNLACRRGRVIKNSELIKKDTSVTPAVFYVEPDDSTCFGSGGGPLTIVDPDAVGTSSDDSLCATVLVEMQAQANDSAALLGAAATTRQGTEVRVDIATLDTECK